jgi:hypothetical protein
MDTIRIRRLCGMAFAVVAASSLITGFAKAEDRGSWFKSLTMPGTAVPCCDIADCQRTDADWHQGQWWAMVHGHWTPIPHASVLGKNSIDGEAYVCSSPATSQIYCFVKPGMVM